MARFAVITIELPFDGGDLEDAQQLADLLSKKMLTDDPTMMGAARLYGTVAAIEIEDRAVGTLGRARARVFADHGFQGL